MLRKMHGFDWIEECRWVFEDLKRFLTSLPLLSKPEVGEELHLYLAASPEAISSILIRAGNRGSRGLSIIQVGVLHDVETRCSILEKIVFALINYV